MDKPTIYAHIAPDGRLLDARTEPPGVWETQGGKVFEYEPKKVVRFGTQWISSDSPEFQRPKEGTTVVCKIFSKFSGGVECEEYEPRYAVVIRWFDGYSKKFCRWAWKYIEP